MRTMIQFVTVCVILSAMSPDAARAQDVAARAATIRMDERLPDDPRVTVGTLANGLRYYIHANDQPENRADLRLVVNVGSIVEDEDQQGLAHFLEHMAFNGTTHFQKQELLDYMESIGMRLGAGVNARTGFDDTVYNLRVPTDSVGALETAIQIMEDWAHGMLLTTEDIDAERGVVIEEWRLGQGAGARMRDVQYPVLYRGSRYAERLPIGQVDVLESFDPESLRRFYRDWYRPDLIAVVAVGDFDEDHVEALIRRHFEGLQPVENPKPRVIYGVPDHGETLFAIATDEEATISNVSVNFKQPLRERGTVGFYQQGIVHGFFNSMLNQRLRELGQQADPPFIGASSSQGRLNRAKEAYVLRASVEDGGIPEGLTALLTEAERVARHGFTDAELERVKTAVLRSMERSYEARATASSASFVNRYINNFLIGSHIAGIEFRYELHKRLVPQITLEEVNRLAREWITDGNRVVLVSAPDKEGLETPAEEDLLAVLEAVSSLDIEPYVDTVVDAPLLPTMPTRGSIVAERTVDTVGVTEWELSNGVRVALKQTDFRDDQILFRAFSPGGLSLVDDADLPAVAEGGGLINASGLGSFSRIDLQKKLTGTVASANASIGNLEERLTGSASPQDLETMFQLIHLRFTAPRADSAVYLSGLARARGSLENRGASPAAAFSDTLQATMTQNHPRAPLPSAEVVEATDLLKSLDFYRDRFADASDFTFIFVGDLDLDAMRPLVEQYVASLPSLNRVETWRDVGPKPPRGVIVKSVYKGVEQQSRSVFSFTGPFEDSRMNRTALVAMNRVLQTRLRDVIREELGGSYGVNVGGGSSWRPTSSYSISIQFGSDPERVEELRRVVFEGIADLQRDGPLAEELETVKEGLRRTRESNLESNSYWLSQLATRYQKGEDLAGFWGYIDVLDALTAEMVRDAARRYYDMENYVQVTLFPESFR